jgi:DNA-binding NarL/FixJ family response regulator
MDHSRTSSIRILLVEDFKPFRSLTTSLLGQNPALNIVCEAEDGLEAVTQAEQLKPDVILMDIRLPTLSGIAAARRIRNLVPFSKIVFLTQETDEAVVKEAFSLGAWGYVLKEEATAHLITALNSVVEGKRFVSRELSRSGFASLPVPEVGD